MLQQITGMCICVLSEDFFFLNRWMDEVERILQKSASEEFGPFIRKLQTYQLRKELSELL